MKDTYNEELPTYNEMDEDKPRIDNLSLRGI